MTEPSSECRPDHPAARCSPMTVLCKIGLHHWITILNVVANTIYVQCTRPDCRKRRYFA